MEIIRWILVFIGMSTLVACREIPYEASPLDPRLPNLSSTGTNTAGAYVDGYSWLVQNPTLINSHQFMICTNGDLPGTRILMSKGIQIVESNPKQRDVGFFLGDLAVKSKNHFMALKDSVINLDGISNYGILILENATSDTLRHGVGKLYIRDVITKEGLESFIVSGTFGFDIKNEGLNHTVYSGRFDFRIRDSNFCNAF